MWLTYSVSGVIYLAKYNVLNLFRTTSAFWGDISPSLGYNIGELFVYVRETCWREISPTREHEKIQSKIWDSFEQGLGK